MAAGGKKSPESTQQERYPFTPKHFPPFVVVTPADAA